MRNQKQTIHRIVSTLNNPEDDGGLWLPNIQRPFVWSEEQICRLFDSILREYPISTLLVWRTTSDLRRRKFIDNWHESLRLTDFFVPPDTKKKGLVLDGQQRLQSLFIALKGSYEGRELYFDILSGDLAAPDDVKYRFRFLTPSHAVFPWIKVKDLVFTYDKRWQAVARIVAMAGRPLSQSERNKIEEHYDLVIQTLRTDEVLTYQELDSIDNPTLYTEDDVVEVFIRANAGGTKLGKSDLLFSLLAAGWEVANDEIERLLEELNRHGFKFDRDFVLKTALTVLGHGARYEVQKFRRPGVREQVEQQWPQISKAIRDVLDFVRGKTFIQGDKGLPTYLVLIPLVYVRYHFPDAWKAARDVDTYILRAALAGAFSGSPDNLLDAIVRRLEELRRFDVDEVFEVIRSQGRSLELTEDRFWHLGYGSDAVHLIFNLWYPRFTYVPAYEDNLPQIDHVFPQSLLRGVKAANPRTGRLDVLRYRDSDRNQLANCMLLTREENGAGGKGATPPQDWFENKGQDYLRLHLIPEDPRLWAVERFDDFIEARKTLIREKFSHLLVGAATLPPASPERVLVDRSEAARRAWDARRTNARAEAVGVDVRTAQELLDQFVAASSNEQGRVVDLLDEFVRRKVKA
jgi:hypothetical protein